MNCTHEYTNEDKECTCKNWIKVHKTEYCVRERDECCDGFVTLICLPIKIPMLLLVLPCVGYTEIRNRCCNCPNKVVTKQPTQS